MCVSICVATIFISFFNLLYIYIYIFLKMNNPKETLLSQPQFCIFLLLVPALFHIYWSVPKITFINCQNKKFKYDLLVPTLKST